mgnify:CR=1 FL=1
MKRILKRIALILALIVIAFTAIGFLLPSSFGGTVTKTITASADTVSDLIATPSSWLTWSPWNADAKDLTVSGPVKGVKAKCSWTKNHRKLSLTITSYEAGKKIGYRLNIEGTNKSLTGLVELTPEGDKLQIQWNSKGYMGNNLLFRWLMFFMGHTMSNEYEKAIERLSEADA